jgi:hypothetical protein
MITSCPRGPPPRGRVVSFKAALILKGTIGYNRSAKSINLWKNVAEDSSTFIDAILQKLHVLQIFIGRSPVPSKGGDNFLSKLFIDLGMTS